MKFKFLESIEKEYGEYKKSMLRKNPEEIWDKCCEIYFYSSFYEYFLYNETISYIVAAKLGNYKNIISGCWELYLKNEELSILSWEDIGQIIDRFLQKMGAASDGKESD